LPPWFKRVDDSKKVEHPEGTVFLEPKRDLQPSPMTYKNRKVYRIHWSPVVFDNPSNCP